MEMSSKSIRRRLLPQRMMVSVSAYFATELLFSAQIEQLS